MKETKRKLAIGNDRMYALRDEKGNIMRNMDEIIQVAERFYTRLYASDISSGKTTDTASLTCDVPLVTKEEVEKVLRDMKRGKAAGDDSITMDLLKEVEDIILKKLAALSSEC